MTKRDAMEALKQADPQAHALILALGKRFGKLENVHIQVRGVTVWPDSGET